MEQRFAGQTVIVTGASGNIGEGITRRFAAEGANVVLTGRNKDKLDALAGTLNPDRTAVVPADVTREADVQALSDGAAARFDGIDVLVSNAGVGHLSPFEDLTIEDWRRVIDTNLTSCFLGAQACLPHLKRAKGSIIQIASASGLGGDVGMSAYNASKGAVVNLTRGLACLVQAWSFAGARATARNSVRSAPGGGKHRACGLAGRALALAGRMRGVRGLCQAAWTLLAMLAGRLAADVYLRPYALDDGSARKPSAAVR